jgi:hypothetical protein
LWQYQAIFASTLPRKLGRSWEELVRIVGSLLAGDREEQFKMQKAELMP